MTLMLGHAFIDELAKAGYLDDPERTAQVVIDARAGEVVRVYVTKYGDESIVNVVSKSGLRMKVEEKPKLGEEIPPVEQSRRRRRLLSPAPPAPTEEGAPS